MQKKFVVDGAELKCSMGTKPGMLMIPMPRKEQLTGKPIANVKDYERKNIPPASFCLCKLTSPPKPCSPECIEWLGGKCNAKSAGENVLLDSSVTVCLAGAGLIEITDCGQKGLYHLGVTDAQGCGYVLIPAQDYMGKPIPVTEDYLRRLGIDLNCCQPGGDPVNMATGNFVYEKEYLKIKGLFSISLGIYYNAQDQRKHALGYGWAHSFEVSVVKDDNKATVIFDDGKEEVFFSGRRGNYIHSQGKDNKLIERDGEFTYQTHEGFKYIFNSSGKLCRKEDMNANFIELSYDVQDRLSVVTSNSGASFEFIYEGNCLKRVVDNTGRDVTFDYNGDTLICVMDELNNKYQFAYNSQNKLARIVNPLGVNILNNEYDNNERIKRQVFPDGGVMSYVYNDAENKLIMTEQNGNEIIYVHDDQYRSVATVYSDGTEKYAYNAQNLRTQYTDKKGNVTRFSYDNRNNMVKSVNPIGEVLNTDFNDLNKPVKIKLCGEVIQRMSYDDRGNVTEIKDALNRGSKIEYNVNGKPAKILQPDGSVIDIEYDLRGNILKIAEPDTTTAYEYDELNRVITTIDGNGNKTGYEYNIKGDIIKVINANGDERKYEYNATGKVTKITDFCGTVLTKDYNSLGKINKVVDQEGNETTLEYDLMWNVTKQTDANGNTTVFDYDALHRLTKVTNALGNSVMYEYDSNGNRTSVIDPRGGETRYSYDELDRVTEVIESNGAETSVTYNPMGQITTITDALGQESIFKYDKAGQKVAAINPAGKKQSYTYNLLGLLSEEIDATGRITKYEYLPGGLLAKVIFPDSRSVQYTYDNNKNVISQTTQDGNTLFYEYDCLNRITKISGSAGQEKSYCYDAIGNVTMMTDANGYTTKFVYSANNNLVNVTDSLGSITTFDYDKLGNLIECRQLTELKEAQKMNRQNSQLHVTKYKWDELGRVRQVTDALGNSEIYTYDEVGNVIGKLDKEGYLTQYSYDLTNQLQEVVYADGKSVILSYNPLKQLTEIKDWLGITSIEVDELGQAKKVTDHSGREVEYTFGAIGERTSIRYPDGSIVAYEYDEALRLKSLTNNDHHVNYIYDTNSRLSEKKFSNGLSTKYTYNSMGLLAELEHSDNGGLLDKYNYTYDNMGNKTGIEKYRRGLEEENGNYQFTYDALARLTKVDKDDKLIRAYGYDEYGNRSFIVEKGVRIDYMYNSLNQLLRTETGRRTQSFSYDARGNLTQVQENGRLKNTYEFGPINLLTRAVAADGRVANYEYNGLRHRVGKKITNDLSTIKNINYTLDLTRHYHNLLQITEDEQDKNYLWDFNLVAESVGGNNRFYLQDELGSPLRVSYDDCSLMDSYAYDEFGNDLTGNQGVMQPFGYTGYRYDDVTQTYFAQAREYNPYTGRFNSVDIIKGNIHKPFSLNEYIYCGNNPQTYIDLTGLEQVVISGGIYSNEKREADAYYYEFIDAGLAQINNLQNPNGGEKITWVIADHGWSDLNRSEFAGTATRRGVDIVFVSDNDQLFNYINYQTTSPSGAGSPAVSSARANDPITNISFFSHGISTNGGVVMLGYDYSNNSNKSLDIGTPDINSIYPEAFSNDLVSSFYSCNTGTALENSFAQYWVNRFGGETTAFVGRTDYTNVSDNSMVAKLARLYIRLRYGVGAYGGNTSLPIAGTDAYQLKFQRINC